MVMAWARDYGGKNNSGSSLKAQPVGFVDGLDVEREGKRRVKNDSNVFSLSNRKRWSHR